MGVSGVTTSSYGTGDGEMDLRMITLPTRASMGTLMMGAALLLAACSSSGSGATGSPPTRATNPAPTTSTPPATTAASTTSTTSSAGGCTVGVAWNGYNVGRRWQDRDGPAIKAAIEGGGGTYLSNDAQASAEQQARNIDDLVAQGADVVVILASDAAALEPTVARTIVEGSTRHRVRHPHR